ncbi:MAG: DUF393 domain-containing protein [Actinobacteria bacterium]|nr:DUF393 domain-containing protein [Actinomycetota bacterium]
MTGRGLTVLYDEACGVCTALAAWLVGQGDGLVVAPIGSHLGDRLLRDLPTGERYATVHAVDSAGRRFSGGNAVPVVLGAMRGWGHAAALARRSPLVTRLGYRILARRRGAFSRLLHLAARERVARGDVSLTDDSGERLVNRAPRRASHRPRSRARSRDARPVS